MVSQTWKVSSYMYIPVYVCHHLSCIDSMYRSWVASVTNSSSRVPSGCTVELFANRPVQQCVSNPVKLKTLIVPMVETEIKGNKWYYNIQHVCWCDYVS